MTKQDLIYLLLGVWKRSPGEVQVRSELTQCWRLSTHTYTLCWHLSSQSPSMYSCHLEGWVVSHKLLHAQAYKLVLFHLHFSNFTLKYSQCKYPNRLQRNNCHYVNKMRSIYLYKTCILSVVLLKSAEVHVLFSAKVRNVHFSCHTNANYEWQTSADSFIGIMQSLLLIWSNKI